MNKLFLIAILFGMAGCAALRPPAPLDPNWNAAYKADLAKEKALDQKWLALCKDNQQSCNDTEDAQALQNARDWLVKHPQ